MTPKGVRFTTESGAFLRVSILRERTHMTKTKENKQNDEVIMCTDETGMQLYLSEKAANRLSWILTGICVVLSLPVIILAFMCI